MKLSISKFLALRSVVVLLLYVAFATQTTAANCYSEASPMASSDTIYIIRTDTVYLPASDTTTIYEAHPSNESRYDHRVHRYRRNWSSLIPTQHVLQFCGNMGLFSVGVGWDYGKRGQWETHLLFGFVPKYSSPSAKLTMTIKQNFLPWSTDLSNSWSFQPLQCGIYFNTIFSSDFWTRQPGRYSSGYYPFSTRIRPNIFVGERMTFKVPHNRRKYIKAMSFFYELSATDIGIMKFGYNAKAGFWDVFGLSLGIKAQLL